MPVGNPASRGLLVVISGPSGVGKTSILREVLRRTGAVFSVSATTRSPAAGERDGVDYYFIDRETFQRWVDERRFIEVAQVFGRNWYGTPREPVERQLADGKIVVLDIDVQGAAEVKRYMPECLAIFILPPSEDELHRRLRDRAREDDDAIARRFAEARKEIAFARETGIYDRFVTNENLAPATDEVERTILAAAGVRAGAAGC
jgi:guanylate kinase